MTDVVLAIGAGTRTEDVGHLRVGGRDLVNLLEPDSWSILSAALETVADSGTDEHLVLFTRDGRTYEADVASGDDGVSVELHDVSRHVDEADGFARLAVQLHRRNRDLETLYDAATRLGQTLDVQALVQITATLVAEYLRAEGVLVTAAGYEGTAGDPVTAGERAPLAAVTLTTARGDLGTMAWWRDTGLSDDERRVLDVVRHRAAVGIDHALLLAPPPSRAERDEHGLLDAATARRRLAGLARPFALALIAHDGDVTALAERIGQGRVGDVRAHWGPRRLLVALAGADVEQMQAWLARSGVSDPDGAMTWPVGVAAVQDDVEAAISAADRALVVVDDRGLR